jgi:GINS complex subunit 1
VWYASLATKQAILRNKRALLVYLNERMNRVKKLRWEVGTGLPANVSSNLSHSERTFFTKYSEVLNEYMREVDLNLTLDLTPPIHHKIQVRCLEDYGELFTKDGSVDLKRNTVHLMWREEAEPLIREGILEQLQD